MAYTKTYKVVNTANPSRVHASVAEFYSLCDDGNPTDADVAKHLANDSTHSVTRDATLSEDGTYVTQVYTWEDEDTYNDWKTAKDALSAIDKDLTITDV